MDATYNVYCHSCERVFQPSPRSPLWWRAKKAADLGRMDAIGVSGEECGCIRTIEKPDAPYRVVGYSDDYREYNIPCFTLVEAFNLFRKYRPWDIVAFVDNTRPKGQSKLAAMVADLAERSITSRAKAQA